MKKSNINDTVIKNIKFLALDQIQKAGSGHPGICLGATDIIYYLFKDCIKFNPNKPNWISRDRFVLSAGHGSAMLYSTLFMFGYDYKIDDLMQFRQIDSVTPGHPENIICPGVEFTTGPLGQGIATGVGIALAQQHLLVIFEQQQLFNFDVYVMCGDGDLQEGISYESLNIAGLYKLNNLIIIHDSNNIQLDGQVSNASIENLKMRMESINFTYKLISTYEDIKNIKKIISNLKKIGKPIFLEIKTIIGRGSVNSGTHKVHGAPLSDSDATSIKTQNNWPLSKFFVNRDAKSFCDLIIQKKITEYKDWQQNFDNISKNNPEFNKRITKYINRDYTDEIQNLIKNITPNLFKNYENKPYEMRNVAAEMFKLVQTFPTRFFGGSADLKSSTKIYGYLGKNNINFGVREFAMGAIINGISMTLLRGFGATFLSFLDYQKAALRLGAISNCPAWYFYSHDSFMIGEDGPTHQPIEQIGTLLNIPQCTVCRPSDIIELCASFIIGLKNINSPTVIILSKNQHEHLLPISCKNGESKFPLLINKAARGIYFVKKHSQAKVNVYANGYELNLLNKVLPLIESQVNQKINLVSTFCISSFQDQTDFFKANVLHIHVNFYKQFSSISHKFFASNHHFIYPPNFGYSAKGKDVAKKLNLNENDLINQIAKIINNKCSEN